MNFKDLKKLCNEHENLLKRTKVIEDNIRRQHWTKISTPESGEFYLDDDERKLLKDYYEKRGLEIENIISKLLNSNS